eukprot:4392947-Amphidinium_carterae.1
MLEVELRGPSPPPGVCLKLSCMGRCAKMSCMAKPPPRGVHVRELQLISSLEVQGPKWRV